MRSCDDSLKHFVAVCLPFCILFLKILLNVQHTRAVYAVNIPF